MILATLAAGALMFQAAPAAVAAAPGAAPATPAAANGGVTTVNTVVKDKLVCHEEQLLGSRLTKKVCATATATAQRKQDDREMVEKWQALRPYVSN